MGPSLLLLTTTCYAFHASNLNLKWKRAPFRRSQLVSNVSNVCQLTMIKNNLLSYQLFLLASSNPGAAEQFGTQGKI